MAIASGSRKAVKFVAANKSYTVTVSPSENVYDETQLFKSIFESLYAVTHTEIQEDADTDPPSEMKGDSIA